MHARAPRDDVVRFTQTSGWSPLAIAALAVALMLGGFALLWWRCGGRAQLRAFRQTRSLALPTRTLALTAAALVGSVALALGLHAAFPVPAAGSQGGGVVLPSHTSGAAHGLASFGPDTTMDVASSRPRLELPPGTWTLRLAAEDTVGRFRAWDDGGEETPGP